IVAIANARSPYPHVDMNAINYLIKVLGTTSQGGAAIIYKDMLKKLQNLPEQSDGSVSVARLTFLNNWFDSEDLGKHRYLHELELIVPNLPPEDETNLDKEISTQVFRSAVKTDDYGEPEKALELYNKALAYANNGSINADKVQIQGRMGWVYERLGRNDEALRCFLLSVGNSPPYVKTNAQAWRLGHIGFNLMKLGRFSEAITYLRAAIAAGDATRLAEEKQYNEWIELCSQTEK
ncbi:MAG: tetratricopeptide repeat protein, partial [Candidatus Obscuribacterales bacterium]|nr:tetratricopeptide repeat protein [Candidatus Obscuribacterales bacterium]